MREHWDLIRPSFLYLMDDKPEGQLVGVEIGVDRGKNLVTMLKYCDRISFAMVDKYEHPELHDNHEPYKHRTTWYLMDSVEASTRFPDRHFDYIYIDAAHDYNNVMRDLRAWYPKIKDGGIFAGHDWWYDGVRRAVTDFFSDKPRQNLLSLNVYSHTGHIAPHDAEMSDWFIKFRL
jgi:hypothetical protein